LFIQGGGRGAHDAWDNKLAASLAQACKMVSSE
jgi:hypothetical protein